MAKKQNKKQVISFNNIVDDLTSRISTDLTSGKDIANVIEFCERSDLLNVKAQGFALWPWQRIILKCFYRGSIGNEDLELTEEEIRLMEENGQTAALKKYGMKNEAGLPAHVKELVLVLGRRSSKTFIISVISAYEIYKLLEINNGDPHEFYGLPKDKEISIINCAVSKEQAKSPLFEEIKARLRNSPYFFGRIGASTEDTIHVYTRKDRERQKELQDDGNPIDIKGSIVLRCGHSNSASLRGKLAIAVIFDELAHFVTSTGKSSGSQVYESMIPSTKTFKEHGRIMSLSNPAGKEGIFYKLYKQGNDLSAQDTICFQLPTWVANETLTREDFKNDFKRDPVSAEMEYGAQFSGSAASNFLTGEQVENIVDLTLSEQHVGVKGKIYHMHIDPAISSHIYGCIIGHVEHYTHTGGEERKKFVVDLIRRWEPEGGKELDLESIDNEIIDLSRRFQLATLTFDNFQSVHSRQRFVKYGLNAVETRFGQSYKSLIYGALREAVRMENVSIPDNYYLINELKELKMKYTHKGYTLYPDQDGEVGTDDLADCLAGALYVGMNFNQRNDKRLPRAIVAYTGFR